jgi:hypothetical protein
MATKINAKSTGGGFEMVPDASGALDIQSNSVTAISIDTSQNVSFTNPTSVRTNLSAAASGANSDITSLSATTSINGTTLSLQTGNTTAIRISGTQNVGIGTISPAVSLDVRSRTDAIGMPSGTTAQRPASPFNGYTRYNTTTLTWEAYSNGGWVALNPNVFTNTQAFITPGTTTWTVPTGVQNVAVLVVGGGGGGGNTSGGGGGGGGVVYVPQYQVGLSATITVQVGAGGAANTVGGSSAFGGAFAYGGGAGGSATDKSFGTAGGPLTGASGGGGGATSTAIGTPAPGGSQGCAGGYAPVVSPYPSGGGGGAGGPGQNASGNICGNGGTGTYHPLFNAYGSPLGYFGGGGGGYYQNGGNVAGVGGAGGGGNGNGPGVANTGGGGGGSNVSTNIAGGSGIVIVKWYQ